MNKLEYLKLALELKLYAKKSWMITAFSLTKEAKGESTIGKLYPEPWGFTFVNSQGEREKIEDSKPNEPLFHFLDRVIVTKEMAANVVTPVETTIGNVLFNAIAILSSFGPKHEFPLGSVSVSALENKIAEKLQDTPPEGTKRSDNVYYVDEYIKFVDALQYITTFTQLATVTVTRRSILPPTGIKEFKDSLLEKYKDQLTDPVVLAKFEKELLDYDTEYLKGDPSFGTFVKGKIKNNARKKMYLAVGAEIGFNETSKATPIINSLSEGWSRNPEQFTASMNSIRYGSFARGSETVKGGVSAKYLLRAANNFKIIDTDCGSKLGMHRYFESDSDIGQIVGRYVIQGGKSTLVEKKEDAGNYLRKQLVLRSPMYCNLEGDTLCKVCAGVKLSQFPNGLTIPLTEVSGIILYTAMKKMHTSGVSTAKMNVASSFS